MRVHVLQHAPFEGLGAVEPMLASRGASFSHTRFFERPALPSLDDVDLVVAMGGPMSVNDEAELPWLRPEKQFVRDAAARSIPMLGICLGAQLIANALGAQVTHGEREIGWFPIHGVAASDTPLAWTGERPAFHWHGETFALPPGAVRLAQSAACANQAFVLPGRIVGLQFHFEMTPDTIGALLEHCAGDLAPGPYVQSADEIRGVPAERFAGMHADLERVIAYVVTGASRG
jgi:GMP synthase-like glutamine amidotransferase